MWRLGRDLSPSLRTTRTSAANIPPIIDLLDNDNDESIQSTSSKSAYHGNGSFFLLTERYVSAAPNHLKWSNENA